MSDEIPGGPWTFPRIVIAIIICAACFGILLVALNVFGVAVPGWAMTMFWICLVAVVAIIAVKFLMKLW